MPRPLLRNLSLRSRLLLLISTALLPVALLGFAALHVLADDKRESLQVVMLDTTRAIAGAMDRELSHAVMVLRLLGDSPDLDQGDLRSFHESLSRALRQNSGWQTITLSDASGRSILDGREPFESQPVSLAQGVNTRVGNANRGDAEIRNLAIDPHQRDHLFGVRLPLYRDGEPGFILSASLHPQVMLDVVNRQTLPPEGLVAIIDAAGSIVARSRAQEKFVGQPVTPDLKAAMVSPSGIAVLYTQEGRKNYAAFVRSQQTGWTVAMGAPQEIVDAPALQSYWIVGIGVLGSLSLGAVLAGFLGRGIARPAAELSKAARSIGRGEEPVIPQSDIVEFREVGEALVAAVRTRKIAEEAKQQVLEGERRARLNAEEEGRLKDQFLAMLGHELRNPIGAISNGVQVLLRLPESIPLARETQAMVVRQVDHLAHLLNDLVQIGRVIAGKIVLQQAPIDLGRQVEEVLATFRSSRRLDNHEVVSEISEVWVHADMHRVEQIISNLLGNALKYTPAGRQVRVVVAAEGDRALLQVIDQGVGMEPEVLRRAFDLFFQGNPTTARTDGGLGVGLTLIQRLVDLHGGTVEAESAGKDRGSTISMWLPRIARPVGTPATRPRVDVEPMRVLIVEDNPDLRSSMSALLAMTGHVVYEASDGPDGVSAAQHYRPDVVFIDIGLPGFDGYECCRRIRSSEGGRSFHLLALTGYGLEEDRQLAEAAGFNGHLVKPLSPERLEEALAQAAGIRARAATSG